MRSHKAIAFALACIFGGFAAPLGLTGCGTSGTTGGGGTPPPTATISASASTITLGQTVTLTIASTNATSCTGSGSLSGTVPMNGTLTETPSSTGALTYSVTCSGSGGTSTPASVTVTVNPAPSTITSVAVSANPTTITTAETSTCTATVQGTGNFSSSVTWTATNGTLSGSGISVTLTPSGTGSSTCTATSTQDATKSGSASVTVTQATPTITGISPSVIYLDGDGFVGNVKVTGTGFKAGGYFESANPTSCCLVQGASVVNSEELLVTLGFADNTYTPGFIQFTDCNSDGVTCSTPNPASTIAFLGNQNVLATSSSGELFFLDQAQGADTSSGGKNGYVRKYKPDGTADGSFYVGSLFNSIALDDKTGIVVIDGGTVNEDGSPTYLDPQGFTSGTVMGSAASNGYAGFVQPNNNSASFYDITGGIASQPQIHTASNLGSEPWSIAMGTFGSETDAFVFSRNGTPSLYKVRASDAYVEGLVVLPGITPVSTVQSQNPVAGGWQVVAFDSGPAEGLVAILSTPDDLLVFVNASTMQVAGSLKLSGIPFRIAADQADGTVIVAYANPQSATTTYSSVNPGSEGTNPVNTPLTSTDTLLSVGLQVSADGTSIYSGQRNQLDLRSNQ